MGSKIVTIIILIVLVGVGIFEHAPQRAWDWFGHTEVGTKLLSPGGERYLPGPLRGLVDPSIDSKLTPEGVVKYTNQQRDANGGHLALHVNNELTAAAEAKVDDMFNKQYFEHQSPDGKNASDIIKAAGYAYLVVGENLALGNFVDDKALVQAWMDSPGHRANILNGRFQEIGVAVKQGQFEGKTVWLAVQEFGTSISTCPQPPGALKAEIDSNRANIKSLESRLAQRKAEIDANQFANEGEYNKAVNEYNSLAQRINDLTDATKDLVEEYNDKANAFNECLDSNT